uniref:Uncharacterized protein n=1 Tax=Eptatretus burgeri TaxID=7764 RepID=A0A8C4QIP6_EPTBU
MFATFGTCIRLDINFLARHLKSSGRRWELSKKYFRVVPPVRRWNLAKVVFFRFTVSWRSSSSSFYFFCRVFFLFLFVQSLRSLLKKMSWWLSLATVAVLLFICPCEDVEAEGAQSVAKNKSGSLKNASPPPEMSGKEEKKKEPVEPKVTEDAEHPAEVPTNNTTVLQGSPVDRPVIQRALYVLVGVTGLVVTYFIIRTISIRRKARKTKRYGILSPSERMELAPLDAGDDDEDESTLFEARQLHR